MTSSKLSATNLLYLIMAATRSIRNRKTTVKSDYVYDGPSQTQRKRVDSDSDSDSLSSLSPSQLSKKDQLKWMRSNPERLVVDKSLQMKENGQYDRDICDVKFCTDRFQNWMDVCKTHYGDRITTKIEKGATKLTVLGPGKDSKQQYVTINFFNKNNLVLIQGKAVSLHKWMKEDKPAIFDMLGTDIAIPTKQTKSKTEEQNISGVLDFLSPANMLLNNSTLEEISLEDSRLGDSIEINTPKDPSNADGESFELDFKEFETIDEIECTMYNEPQITVHKSKHYDSLMGNVNDLKVERDHLRQQVNDMSRRLASASSHNVTLQQEIMHLKSYIRQLSNDCDMLNATVNSLNMSNFISPTKTTKRQDFPLIPVPITSPNRFNLLQGLDEVAGGTKEKRTSTPVNVTGRQVKATQPRSKPRVPESKKTPHSEMKVPNIDCHLDFPRLESPRHSKTLVGNMPCPSQDRKVANTESKETKVRGGKAKPQTGTPAVETCKKRIKDVMIIGDSMVRGSASHFKSVSPSCYDPITYTHPGASIERITDGLVNHKRYVTPEPDYIILHAGTNNVKNEEVVETICKLDDLMSEAMSIFPTSKVLVSGIVRRKDNVALNSKIDSLNIFLAHKCEKTPQLYYVNNESCAGLLNRDGLHLNAMGKEKLARNFLNTIRNSSFPQIQDLRGS